MIWQVRPKVKAPNKEYLKNLQTKRKYPYQGTTNYFFSTSSLTTESIQLTILNTLSDKPSKLNDFHSRKKTRRTAFEVHTPISIVRSLSSISWT